LTARNLAYADRAVAAMSAWLGATAAAAE